MRFFKNKKGVFAKKDHLFDDLIKALESKGYHSPADFTLTSTPYERKAPKRNKTKKK